MLVVFTTTAFVGGRRLVRRIAFDSVGESWLISIAIGVAALGHALFVMGLAGLLEPLPLAVLLACVHLFGRSAWREGWQEVRRVGSALSGPRAAVVALLAAVLLLPLFLFPLYPPVSFDSTMYHLPYAKAFAATGGLPFLEALRYPVFPQLMEVLFAGVLLLGDDIGAQLLQLLVTLLTAGLVFVWGREAFGRTAAWIGAAAYLGNPMVGYLAGTAFVEPGLALFSTAALFAIWRWRQSRESAWLILAAVFASSAAATKYLGLLIVAAIGLIVVLAHGPRARWRDALQYTAAGAAILVPWYGRIFLHTGSPFFPYFHSLFGSNPWEHPPNPAKEESPFSVLTLPWDLVFRREILDWHPPLSPVYLIALPLVLIAAFRDARVRRLLLVAGAYSFLVRAISSDPRYLLPILPLVSVTVAAGLALLPITRRLLTAAVLLLLLPGWLYVAWQIRRLGSLPVTAEQKNEFLERRLPAYPAIRYLNRTRGSDYTLYAFHAENMVYFADGRFLGDWFGPASFKRVLDTGVQLGAVHSRLSALGVDHLLVVKGRPPPLALDGPLSTRWFRKVYEDPHARVFALTAVGPTGQIRDPGVR